MQAPSAQYRQYKKSWVISTIVARDMIGMTVGERLPTIAEYAQRLDSSRGVVQSALAMMESAGAIRLEKRGKSGTFLIESDLAKLFDLADMQYITASMPPPLNSSLAALATGVCVSMDNCPATFNFGFMHSSENRSKALVRQVYDFVIVSHYSAKKLVKLYPELSIALVMKKAYYSPKFYLYSNRMGVRHISDGDRIAADPNSNDQYDLTLAVCEGKKVEIVHEPYLSTRIVFENGSVDFVVQRSKDGLADRVIFEQIEIPEQTEDMMVAAVLVNKNNYGMDSIARRYLDDDTIAFTQEEVDAGRMRYSFY